MLGAIRAGTGGGAVASVYGRSGAVVAANGDYASSQIAGLGASAAPLVVTPGALQALIATSTIAATAGVIPISAAAPITLSSNPQVSAGLNGQKLQLINVGSTNPITLANGNGLLIGQAIVLYPGKTIDLTYSSAYTSWVADWSMPESVALTGVSTAPNPAWNTNSTQIAPTGWVYRHLYDHDAPGWRALTLAPGWAIFGGATYGGLGVKRIGRDIVCLRGIVQVSGTFNSTIIAASGLPIDCRPSAQVVLFNATSPTAGLQIDVAANGSIITFATMVANQIAVLNGMWFL